MISKLSTSFSLFPVFVLFLLSFAFYACDGDQVLPDGDVEVNDKCTNDLECPGADQICQAGSCIDKTDSLCTSADECIEDIDCLANHSCTDECKCEAIVTDGDTDTIEDGDTDAITDGDSDDPVDDCPKLVAETIIDFGAVPYDTDSIQTINIQNECTGILTISSMEFVGTSNEFSLVTPLTEPITVVGPDEVVKFDILYHPTDIGADQVELVITSDSGNPTYRVTLTSQYKGVVDISATPNPVDFQEVLTNNTAAATSLFVYNNKGSDEGNAVLKVTNVYFENNQGNIFRLPTNPAPFTLGQNEQKEIELECAPSSIGEFNDRLVLDSNDPDSPKYYVNVHCKGIQPTLNVQILEAGDILDFGVQAINASTNIILTLSNTGGGNLVVQVPTLTQDSDPAFQLDTSNFNGVERTLQDGTYETLTVIYNPTDENEHTGKITFETNQQNNPTFTVNLKGEAKPASIICDPNPIDFIPQRVGSSQTKLVTCTNDGEVELTVTNFTLSEDHGSVLGFDAADVLSDVTLAPSESHTVNIVFNPAVKGTYNSMMHLALDDAVTQALDVPINAIGTAPVMLITERDNPSFVDTLDFGDVSLGERAEKTLDITNNGDAVLNITGMELLTNSQDEEFSYENIGLVQVLTGQTVSVRMYYDPVDWPGPDNGSFKISSDDPEATSATILLTGRATNQFAIYSSGPTLDFGEHHYGSVVTDKIEITNGGQIGTLVINDIDMVNIDNEFTHELVDATLPIELYANENPALRNKLVVRVTFTPPLKDRPEPAAEQFSNGLRIKSNSYQVPTDGLQLIGTGAPCPDGYWDNDSDHNTCEYGECFLTNNNIEICDNIDNDCNGITDDGENVADNCIPPVNAVSICTDGTCDFECAEDFHLCDNFCVDDMDIDHCGESCDPCPNPLNGVPTCVREEGVAQCTFVCDDGYHACDDVCADNTSPLTCGDSCIPCPEPPDGGEASCVNGVCDTACDPGYYQNGTSCVPCNTADHCGSECLNCGEDPAQGSFSCQDGACRLYCEMGFHACGNQCYDSDDVNSCGERCIPCPEPESGGYAECNGGDCNIVCIDGFYLHNYECLLCTTAAHCGMNCMDCGGLENGSYTCLNGECFPGCDEGFHLCGDECVSNNEPAHCGDSCLSCDDRFGPLPDGAWVCSNGSCEVGCEAGFHECDGACVLNNNPDHCGTSCDTCEEQNGILLHGDYICPSGQCVRDCDDHFVLDGTTCIPDNSIYCCGTTCETCAPGFNSNPVCVEDNGIYGCETVCEDNYWDLDGDGTHCEYACEFLSEDDLPDSEGIDANCDGIDGMLNHSIFVSTTNNGGSDEVGNGTREFPYATIAKGITMASSCSGTPCDVLVSAGQYTQTLTLVSGVSLYGGYDADDWSHNVTIQSTIAGTEARTIIANSLTEDTTIQGFTITGKDFTNSGQSTYTIWVNNSTEEKFKVEHCLIHGGIGGKGVAGSAGNNGLTGNQGGSGSGSSGGSGGYISSCYAKGGNGGSSYDCGNNNGSTGSAGGDTTTGGAGGAKGSNKCGGCNDTGGNGSAGSNGNNGANGSAGITESNGTGFFSGGYWTNNTSGTGTRGKNGRGGGGGGAGGTDEDPWTCVFWSGTEKGGGGGGGGAAGCHGKGGSGGGPGGGSFAITLIDSTMKITDSTIFIGTGGKGGNGGTGGDGGSGKGGGAGYSPSNEEGGKGGKGGTGGNGGGGGGGAGGCGGTAIGIANVGSSGTITQRVYYEAGSGGSGGTGGTGGRVGGTGTIAASGNTGCTGLTFTTNTYAK